MLIYRASLISSPCRTPFVFYFNKIHEDNLIDILFCSNDIIISISEEDYNELVSYENICLIPISDSINFFNNSFVHIDKINPCSIIIKIGEKEIPYDNNFNVSIHNMIIVSNNYYDNIPCINVSIDSINMFNKLLINQSFVCNNIIIEYLNNYCNDINSIMIFNPNYDTIFRHKRLEYIDFIVNKDSTITDLDCVEINIMIGRYCKIEIVNSKVEKINLLFSSGTVEIYCCDYYNVIQETNSSKIEIKPYVYNDELLVSSNPKINIDLRNIYCNTIDCYSNDDIFCIQLPNTISKFISKNMIPIYENLNTHKLKFICEVDNVTNINLYNVMFEMFDEFVLICRNNLIQCLDMEFVNRICNSFCLDLQNNKICRLLNMDNNYIPTLINLLELNILDIRNNNLSLEFETNYGFDNEIFSKCGPNDTVIVNNLFMSSKIDIEFCNFKELIITNNEINKIKIRNSNIEIVKIVYDGKFNCITPLSLTIKNSNIYKIDASNCELILWKLVLVNNIIETMDYLFDFTIISKLIVHFIKITVIPNDNTYWLKRSSIINVINRYISEDLILTCIDSPQLTTLSLENVNIHDSINVSEIDNVYINMCFIEKIIHSNTAIINNSITTTQIQI